MQLLVYDFLDSPIHPTKNYILRAPIQYMYLEINVNADVRSEDSTKVGLQVLSLALFTIQFGRQYRTFPSNESNS